LEPMPSFTKTLSFLEGAAVLVAAVLWGLGSDLRFHKI